MHFKSGRLRAIKMVALTDALTDPAFRSLQSETIEYYNT